MTEPEPRAPQRAYSNHVLIGGGSSSHPILKTFQSGNFSRGRNCGRRNFAPKSASCRHQMSVKMRGPADVVIFSVTGQKYFTSARLGAVQGRNEVSRPNDWATPVVLRVKFRSTEPKSRNLWPARELEPKIGEHVRELYWRPRLEYFFKFARWRPLFAGFRGRPSKNDWAAQLNKRLQKPAKT